MGEGYVGPPVGHGERLEELRKRMEVEKKRVINYIENKRQAEILRDVAEFWEYLEMKVYHEDEKEIDSSIMMERQKMIKCKQDQEGFAELTR